MIINFNFFREKTEKYIFWINTVSDIVVYGCRRLYLDKTGPFGVITFKETLQKLDYEVCVFVVV